MFYYYKDIPTSDSVKVNEIINIVPLDDGGVYVIFTNIIDDITESSSVKLYRDNSGWFVTAIHMGLDFSNLSEHLKTPEPAINYTEIIRNLLPMLVFFITVIAVIVILYKLVLF